MTDRRKVFSGVQPTGNMHIGNYLGAFRNWVKLQEQYDAIYCVVDLHALTIPGDPKVLHQNRLDAARVLLAVGIDPDRSLFYLQSQVPQHAELQWILSTMMPTGVLNRMTQFKEKSDRGRCQPWPLCLSGVDGCRHPCCTVPTLCPSVTTSASI